MDIQNVHRMVYLLLSEKPETRDSDDTLYCEFAYKLGLNNETFGTVFTNRKELGLPPYETVRRARQKVQAEHPELKGNRVKERQAAEEVFREYAVS